MSRWRAKPEVWPPSLQEKGPRRSVTNFRHPPSTAPGGARPMKALVAAPARGCRLIPLLPGDEFHGVATLVDQYRQARNGSMAATYQLEKVETFPAAIAPSSNVGVQKLLVVGPSVRHDLLTSDGFLRIDGPWASEYCGRPCFLFSHRFTHDGGEDNFFGQTLLVCEVHLGTLRVVPDNISAPPDCDTIVTAIRDQPVTVVFSPALIRPTYVVRVCSQVSTALSTPLHSNPAVADVQEEFVSSTVSIKSVSQEAASQVRRQFKELIEALCVRREEIVSSIDADARTLAAKGTSPKSIAWSLSTAALHNQIQKLRVTRAHDSYPNGSDQTL